jgi:general secretion pathway protein J
VSRREGCRHPRVAGFTLLELLVALAIFAVVAALAYGGLRVVLDARERTDAQAQRLAEIQMALAFLTRDLEQAVDRPIRDELGDRRPALLGGTGAALEWTHGGWRNPAGQARSSLQRVAYAHDANRLVRRSWAVLDRAHDSAGNDTVLLEGVTALELRFLDGQMEWQTFWPPAIEDAPGLPRAVELRLELEDGTGISRLVRLPG